MNSMFSRRIAIVGISVGLAIAFPGAGRADKQKFSEWSAPVNQVLEWNQIFVDTLIATNTANSSSQRLGAIVHTAIFDAYNGIDRRYTPMFVQSAAPRAASRRAAANRRRAHRVGGSVPVPTISARCQLCRLARASA